LRQWQRNPGDGGGLRILHRDRHAYISSFNKSEPITPAVPTIRSVWMMVSDLREDDAEEVLEEVTGSSKVQFRKNYAFVNPRRIELAKICEGVIVRCCGE
jgi:hypothetical protein